MKRIAIDLGSGLTKIYMLGSGVVLNEATCIAVEEIFGADGQKKFSVKACGEKARALSGRAAQNTLIVNPVFEGDIIHPNLAAYLLSYFLEKVEITGRKLKRTEAIFVIPCGLGEQIKNKYRQLAADVGFETAYFTFTPFAAVLGHNVSISESTPKFSLDIGYSITNIAAFSQDGIIAGLNVNLGGSNIDKQLIDELAENSAFRVGTLTAEKLKNTVGSLLHDDNKMAVVDGRDVKSGAPTSLCVNSEMLLPIINVYVDKILEYVQLVISKLPPEVASAVMRGGIYLTGGLIKLDGLPEYIESKLKIAVNIPEEPQLAAVIGGGAILSDDELLDRLAIE